MEFIIFVDPSVVAQFFLSMPRGREEDSKEIDEFYTFCSNIISPLDGSYEMLYTNFGKNQPSSSWEEDISERRTKDDGAHA